MDEGGKQKKMYLGVNINPLMHNIPKWSANAARFLKLV